MNTNKKFLKIFLSIFVSMMLFFSCKKITDPTPPDISDQLQSRYCNDPFAVNYNDSFPGIPDNSRCYYPQDFVTGSWEIKDSVFRQDGEFIEYLEKTIQFEAITTEEKNTVNMKNWCSSSEKVHLTINKFGKLDITTTLEFPDEGQVVCASDTLIGFGNYKVKDTDTTISFEITEKKTSGLIKIHKFIGTKI